MHRPCCCTVLSSKHFSPARLYRWNARQPEIQRRRYRGLWTDFHCQPMEGMHFFPIFSSARSHYFVSTETENATICSFSNNHRVHVSSGVIVCETKFICARFECIARNIHRNLCGKRVTVTDEAYKYNGTNFFVVSLAVCCELYRMLYSIIWDMEWRCDCCTVTRC